MFKSLCVSALLLAAPSAQADARLSETETRWIAAGMSVIGYARGAELPIDIVVQPSDQPDASPIAMGVKDGRCKLVLSMRGNPGATALLASVPPDHAAQDARRALPDWRLSPQEAYAIAPPCSRWSPDRTAPPHTGSGPAAGPRFR